MVFENYYYVSTGLGVKPTTKGSPKVPLITSPDNLLAASNSVCTANWTVVAKTYPKDQQPKDNNLKWCFSSTFASSFLIDGLNVKHNKKIVIEQSVDGSDVEWALGAALKEVLDLAKKAEKTYGMHR
jgi:Golgi nucleoside diphosphatase